MPARRREFLTPCAVLPPPCQCRGVLADEVGHLLRSLQPGASLRVAEVGATYGDCSLLVSALARAASVEVVGAAYEPNPEAGEMRQRGERKGEAAKAGQHTCLHGTRPHGISEFSTHVRSLGLMSALLSARARARAGPARARAWMWAGVAACVAMPRTQCAVARLARRCLHVHAGRHAQSAHQGCRRCPHSPVGCGSPLLLS